jgi:Phosphate-selective porin O and P
VKLLENRPGRSRIVEHEFKELKKMKKLILLALAVTMIALPALAGPKVSGYMAPRFEMIDKGEDNAKNVGFGMTYNRFVFTGEMEGGEIVKKVKYRVETDISSTTSHGLQWVFADLYFNDNTAVRVGRMKEPFSRETLHSTAKQITTGRHFYRDVVTLGFGGFSYGMEARVKQDKWSVQAGLYDNNGAEKAVKNQDPSIDLGARLLVTPAEGIEIGANAMVVQIPQGGPNNKTYADNDSTALETNSVVALGIDFEYKKSFGESHLWLEGEFDTGDNYKQQKVEAIEGEWYKWEDAEFEKFTYMYFRALFMVNKTFGVHLGYSMFDPNTEKDDDGITALTPGVTYYWGKTLWSKAEMQIMGDENDDSDDDTHFVLQTVLIWN